MRLQPSCRRQSFLLFCFIVATLATLISIHDVTARDLMSPVNKEDSVPFSPVVNLSEKATEQISQPKTATENSLSLDKNELSGNKIDDLETKKIENKTAHINLLRAVISLIAAIFGVPIIWLRFRRKKIIREKSSYLDFLSRFVNNLNIPLRRLKQAQDSFFKEIFKGPSADYLKYLFLVFTAKKGKDICNACDNLYHFLKDNLSTNIPHYLVESGANIVAQKCNHNKEKVSDVAFNCFSSFFNFSVSPDIFLDGFSNLLKENNPKHAKYRAIIELCSFVKYPIQLNWNAKLKYLAFMKKTFQDLYLLECEAWSEKDTALAKKCIGSLSAFRDIPDIMNELLPPATNVTEKHIKELINVYDDTVLNIGDSSRFKHQMTTQICRQIERWLKKDNIEDRIKEEIFPRLINYFNPNRKIRLSLPRINFERKVSLSALDVPQDFRCGQTKNISDTGLCFKLQGYLLDAPYQERVLGADGFRFQVDNKILKIATFAVRIFEANEKDVWIEVKAESLRAWIEPSASSILMTGFGIKFIDYDKAKISSYLEKFK